MIVQKCNFLASQEEIGRISPVYVSDYSDITARRVLTNSWLEEHEINEFINNIMKSFEYIKK